LGKGKVINICAGVLVMMGEVNQGGGFSRYLLFFSHGGGLGRKDIWVLIDQMD